MLERAAGNDRTRTTARSVMGKAGGQGGADKRGSKVRAGKMSARRLRHNLRHPSRYVRSQKHLASVWKYVTYFRRMFFQLMSAKNVIKKTNVKHHNYQCYGIREIFQPRPIHELTHFSLAACKHHQWNDGKWQLQT